MIKIAHCAAPARLVGGGVLLFSGRRKENIACGEFNIACGEFNIACGEFNIACGEFNIACGEFNIACGEFNIACGEFAQKSAFRKGGRRAHSRLTSANYSLI